MIIEVPRENIATILDTDEPQETSILIRDRVIDARTQQSDRFSDSDIMTNADMWSNDIDTYIERWQEQKDFLTHAASKLHLSGRVVHRIIKIARTIADLDQQDTITTSHLAEAMQYRAKHLFLEE